MHYRNSFIEVLGLVSEEFDEDEIRPLVAALVEWSYQHHSRTIGDVLAHVPADPDMTLRALRLLADMLVGTAAEHECVGLLREEIMIRELPTVRQLVEEALATRPGLADLSTTLDLVMEAVFADSIFDRANAREGLWLLASGPRGLNIVLVLETLRGVMGAMNDDLTADCSVRPDTLLRQHCRAGMAAAHPMG